jgi:hypothetical protein
MMDEMSGQLMSDPLIDEDQIIWGINRTAAAAIHERGTVTRKSHYKTYIIPDCRFSRPYRLHIVPYDQKPFQATLKSTSTDAAVTMTLLEGDDVALCHPNCHDLTHCPDGSNGCAPFRRHTV